jgi:hypothetical protein
VTAAHPVAVAVAVAGLVDRVERFSAHGKGEGVEPLKSVQGDGGGAVAAVYWISEKPILEYYSGVDVHSPIATYFVLGA